MRINLDMAHLTFGVAILLERPIGWRRNYQVDVLWRQRIHLPGIAQIKIVDGRNATNRFLDKPEKPLVFGNAGNVRLRIFQREDFWRNEFVQGFVLRANFTIFRWFYCMNSEGQIHDDDVVEVILSVELSHSFIFTANKKRNLVMDKSSPGNSPTISLAGTRLSAQPIHKYFGVCWPESLWKNPGSCAVTCATQRRLFSKRWLSSSIGEDLISPVFVATNTATWEFCKE
jgi:hypothetical protein